MLEQPISTHVPASAGGAGPASRGRATIEVARVLTMAGFAVAVFPRLTPIGWAEGLDPSWQMALHQAVSRGLVFGRDFVFTYGPLGFVAYPHDMGGLLVSAAIWRLSIYVMFCVAIGLHVWCCRSLVVAILLPFAIALSRVQDNFPNLLLFTELAFLVYSLRRRVFWPALPAAFLAAASLLT